jgi:hypothetical protein
MHCALQLGRRETKGAQNALSTQCREVECPAAPHAAAMHSVLQLGRCETKGAQNALNVTCTQVAATRCGMNS